MNPFSLDATLLARHAQHVVLVHFPIALFLASYVLDVAGRLRRAPALCGAAYQNLRLAAWATIPTIATGLAAWRWQLEGARLRGNLLLHAGLAVGGSTLIVALWLVRRRRGAPESGATRGELIAGTVAVIAIAVAAHVGGIVAGLTVPAGAGP